MEIVFERRYRGPLTSANGGYASGRLAQLLGAPEVEVALRRPPPLDRALRVRESDQGVTLLDRDAVLAEARPAAVELEPPPVVSVAEATDAVTRHVRIGSALFRECFTCGIREERDGLEIYAGPVSGREPLHAAPWTAHEASPEVVWAAIDCPGAYAVGVEGRGEIVLGRMAARVERVPAEGEDCVVVSWPLGEDGRKLYAGTALLTPEGELLAIARQTWIEPRAS
jgi:hypothetical protein